MISKELLSDVLEVDNITEIKTEYTLIYVYSQVGKTDAEFGNIINVDTINIYELAHKCKEWALSKGLSLDINYSWLGTGSILIIIRRNINAIHILSVNIDSINNIGKIPEPKAIFQACQWILDND